MITRIVKMSFQPEKVNEFLELFHSSKQLIRNMEGCSHLELLRDKECQHLFFTYSKWDTEEHLQAYRHSEMFDSIWSRTKILFNQKPEAWSICSEALL
jgi:autoinducer 2-degrading protein